MVISRFKRMMEKSPTMEKTPMPPALAATPDNQIVDLDVREELRNGEEPFSKIMAARGELPPGGVLRVRAIFEPAPLYKVLGRQGFDHWTEELADEDWRVWFYPAEQDSSAENGDSGTAAVGEVADVGDDVIVIDVRGMEPPEPMVRTLAALEELPAGKTLLHINERIPQFLLPRLEELGFTYDIREQNSELYRVFIRHRTS
ncbi:MAG TPA: DUF2249 domain-containing protein [Longimicrobiaceae bacterium]|nr:DUF2249 domain-containing protein [Longimicrobiaceae bacterium]